MLKLKKTNKRKLVIFTIVIITFLFIYRTCIYEQDPIDFVKDITSLEYLPKNVQILEYEKGLRGFVDIANVFKLYIKLDSNQTEQLYKECKSKGWEKLDSVDFKILQGYNIKKYNLNVKDDCLVLYGTLGYKGNIIIDRTRGLFFIDLWSN